MGMKGKYLVAGQVEVDAYAKVGRINGSKQSGFSAAVDIYASKQAADEAKAPLFSFSYDYPFVAGLDPLEAAYLKMPFVNGLPFAPSPVLEEGQSVKATPDAFKPAAE